MQCRCVPEVLCTFQDDTSLYILLNGRLAGGLHELGAKVREYSREHHSGASHSAQGFL